MLKFHGLGVDAYDRQTSGRAPQAEVLTPGYKYNLTDINAAIALTQLVKLEHLNTRRREIAQQYQQALAALPFQPLSLPAAARSRGICLLFVSMNNVVVSVAMR